MSIWFVLMLAALVAWGWLRYRLLFPAKPRQLQITPLDRQEIERIRQQAAANAQSAGPAPVVPDAAPTPPPTPAPERPITGRAVFTLPDDPPPPPGPQAGQSR
ncbi:MAG: hypothetical protein Q4G62_02695 [Pseudomonadota bacterium]|nr:hypothetical protein [Pseudomonadota bacterium]